MSAREALDLMESRLPREALMAGNAPNPSRTDLRLLIEGVARLLAPQAAAGELALATHIDPSVAELVTLDGARLRQVLVNLTGNAIKFTREGGVGIFARHEDGVLRIDVADSGPGVAAEDREHIFQERVHAVEDNEDGHGLGLAICRRIVEAMDGSLSLAERGDGRPEGARFQIDIPVKDAPASGVTTQPRGAVRLDLPHSPARDALARAVRDCGFAVRMRGRADMIISETPGGGGDDDARRILIGHGDDAHERSGLEWLTWPVRQTSLERLLSAAPETKSAPLRILLVEDDPVAATLARRGLTALGHRVTQVETIAAARKAARGGGFDAAFVDNHLPDGRGDELLASWAGPGALLMSAEAIPGGVQKPVAADAWSALIEHARRNGSMEGCKATA